MGYTGFRAWSGKRRTSRQQARPAKSPQTVETSALNRFETQGKSLNGERFESLWKSWSLLTLETRMEQCRRNSRQG
ncbi:hypothetical protein, partial [Mycobacterium avium]